MQRERFLREIQGLHRAGTAAAVLDGENVIIPDAPLHNEDAEDCDPSSPLSQELQLYPWAPCYKPRIPTFDGKANPKKFLTSYKTAVVFTGGYTQTLAKKLIMVVKDIAHDWYTLLKSLSVHSWQQLKAELLSTFQSYQPGAKTTRDLLNCIQRDDEPYPNI